MVPPHEIDRTGAAQSIYLKAQRFLEARQARHQAAAENLANAALGYAEAVGSGENQAALPLLAVIALLTQELQVTAPTHPPLLSSNGNGHAELTGVITLPEPGDGQVKPEKDGERLPEIFELLHSQPEDAVAGPEAAIGEAEPEKQLSEVESRFQELSNSNRHVVEFFDDSNKWEKVAGEEYTPYSSLMHFIKRNGSEDSAAEAIRGTYYQTILPEMKQLTKIEGRRIKGMGKNFYITREEMMELLIALDTYFINSRSRAYCMAGQEGQKPKTPKKKPKTDWL